MKKLLSVAAFFFALASVAVAQEKVAAAKAESGPAVKFEKYTVDYGTIEYNSDPFRTFRFTNVGTEPLIVTDIARNNWGTLINDVIPQFN